MTQPIRVKRQLAEVCRIGKPTERTPYWLETWWHDDKDGYQRASTHNTVDAFRKRQIARGMTIKEDKLCTPAK